MWLPKIIAMCTIYVHITSAAVTDSLQPPLKNVANLTAIKGVCFTWECLTTASWIRKNMNFSVDPCDDFYEFTCGRFGKEGTNTGANAKDVFDTANDELDTRLKYIIEDIDEAKAAKPFKLVKILYDNCMNSDEDTLSEDGISEYYHMLHGSFGWPVIAGNDWRGFTINKQDFLSTFLEVKLKPDMHNSGYLVPTVNYRRKVLDSEILRAGFDNKIVQAYYNYMVDVAVIFGADRGLAENELKEAVLAEISLANDTVPEVDRWMRSRAYTRMTVEEFVTQYPNLHLREFVYSRIPQAYELTDDDAIMVPKGFANVEKVVSQTPKRVLANLIWWLRVKYSAASSIEEVRIRTRQFENLLERPARTMGKWQECVETVRLHLGPSLSALYQRKYIDQKITSDTQKMATSIKGKIYEIVKEAKWLDSASKEEALQKVSNIIGHVSFRDEYKDDQKLIEFYKDLELVEGDVGPSIANISAFLTNISHIHPRSLLRRDDWTLDGNLVSTSGAYNPDFNTYTVPAGFVLPDYYGLHRAKFLSYAMLGYTIAHEMSHSLDSSNIFFDKNSNLREWRSSQSKKEFDNRVQCMIDQYGNYTVDGVGLKLRAYRTLAENVADNLGVEAAYRAYLEWAGRNKVEDLLPALVYTRQQMFWIGLGSAQCQRYQNLQLDNVVLGKPHSPAKFRVNGPLANTPAFSNDFGCKLGSRMNPVQKCSVW